jgi:hypothetical protein
VDLYIHFPTRFHGVMLNYLSTEENFTLLIKLILSSNCSLSLNLQGIYVLENIQLTAIHHVMKTQRNTSQLQEYGDNVGDIVFRTENKFRKPISLFDEG